MLPSETNGKITSESNTTQLAENLMGKDIRCQEINKLISFKRKFEKWDTINKAIMLVAISELKYSNNFKDKIILNDYLEISKSFVNLKDTKIINAILDKFIK